MKRKGRVISSGKESAASADAAPSASTHVVANAFSRPSAATHSGEAPVAAVSIPTLDIFSKFQSRRDDFEAEWLMMQDDAMDESAEPPLRAELSEKLKQHQGLLGSNRRAARQQNAAASSTLKADEAFDKANVSVPDRKRRRAAPQDSSDDDDSSDRSSNSDDEYDPENESVQEQQAVPEEEEEDGLRGDYLNFLSKTAGGNDAAVESSSLQATVSFGGQERGDNNNSSNRMEASRHALSPSPGPSSSQLVVPLWSVSRMQQYGSYCRDSPLVALHQEVTDLLDFLRPTQGEVSVRRSIEMDVAKIARKLWPGCEPIVYGSMYTHLLLPLSDVDITIANVPVSPEEALPALAAEIAQLGICEEAYPQVILRTKVPLVKFQHKGSLIDVDISVNAQDGKRNSDMVIELLNTFPEARPLILVIKYFLQQRDMHEPYHGGLGSYATVLMAISFLQNHPIHTTRPQDRAFTGIGKLLVDFFRYYGQCWRYQKCGISVEDGGKYFYRIEGETYAPGSPTTPRSPMGPPQAVIEDPGNPANNAASSLRNLHMITSVFTHAYMSLTAIFPSVPVEQMSPDAADIALRPTLLSRILHVDAATVGRRKSIAAAYQKMCDERPQYMDEVTLYRRDEDVPMLEGKGCARRAVARAQQASSGECRSLASLAAAAAVRSPSRSPRVQPAKRPLSPASERSNKYHRVDDSNSSSGSRSSSEASSGSNASSVRVDVSRTSKRKEQMKRR